MHGRQEELLAHDLETVLRPFYEVLWKKLRLLAERGALTELAVHRLFDDVSLMEALLSVIRPHVLRGLALGARFELMLHGQTKHVEVRTKHDDGERPDWSELPAEVREGIEVFVHDLSTMPYWRDMARRQRDRLVAAIRRSMLGNQWGDLIDRIRAVLGPEETRARAVNIARTETTGALNAGKYQAQKYLEKEGVIKGKEWLAVIDSATRPAHKAAHRQQRAIDKPFDVGGHAARYPGDHALPASQRVRCRCTMRSMLADDGH